VSDARVDAALADAAMRNLAGRYCAAVLSGDPDDFEACWAEDAEWVVPGGTVIAGREKIMRTFARAREPFELCVQELTAGVVEVVGEGSAVRAHARWQIREDQWRTDGSQTYVLGVYSDEAGPGPDGVWRFTRRQFDVVRRGQFE
jgi:uncharacterized protein (TIGR02246 family)